MKYQNTAERFLATLDIRAGSVVTQKEIKSLTRHFNTPASAAAGYRGSGICATNEAGPYQVDASGTEAGIKWWRNKLFTPSGGLRQTAFVKQWPSFYRLDAIGMDISHFELIGWDQADDEKYRPLYWMYGASGDRIMFLARPWQSGGNTLDW